MTEAKFQTAFSKWLRHNLHFTAAYELKLVKGKAMPFDAVKPHQVEALLHAEREHIIYKIPDDTIGQKPFDTIKVAHAQGDVVIMFYEKGVKHFYMIPIEVFIKERDSSRRKSLTEDRAGAIGVRYLLGVTLEAKSTLA